MPDNLLFLPPPGRVVKRERRRIGRARYRANKAQRPATLNIHEWLSILNHYGWRCALCRGKFETLEHIVPLSEGGGTTAENCVPACRWCNSSRDTVIQGVRVLRAAVKSGRLHVLKDVYLVGLALLFEHKKEK